MSHSTLEDKHYVSLFLMDDAKHTIVYIVWAAAGKFAGPTARGVLDPPKPPVFAYYCTVIFDNIPSIRLKKNRN